MADYYVGEIRMFAGNYAPENWALCDGSTLSIAQNELLYAVIGTTYGGDSVSNFKLPDLRGRVPIHRTNSLPLGTMQGAETVSLSATELPSHTHQVIANPINATLASPSSNMWGNNTNKIYTSSNPLPTLTSLSSQAVSSNGQSLAHNNMMPSQVISFIIALQGIFPSSD